MRSHHLRLLSVCLLVFTAVPALTGKVAARAVEHTAAGTCPVLVLSAMPLEIDPILQKASLNSTPVWVDNGKGFWKGTVEGNPAVFAITGIGTQNAAETTKAAFEHFACFSLVVFSGASGGDFIGDVMVPARWTTNGKTYTDTSSKALSLAANLAAHPPTLEQTTPAGDPLCACSAAGNAAVTTPVTVEHKPQVEVGGIGVSHDGFGGRALPCTPAADDVFGCWPCAFPDTAAAAQAENLGTTVPPFLNPSFFLDYESASAAPPGSYVSDDMETAASFAVAAEHGVPVIGFRSASDGGGDPLHLPGFPAEFFLYRQLAANNAASVALAFLSAWHRAN